MAMQEIWFYCTWFGICSIHLRIYSYSVSTLWYSEIWLYYSY